MSSNMNIIRHQILLTLMILNSSILIGQQGSPPVSQLKVTTLSTMLVNGKGVGEWGYSALIEVDGKKILFDTGSRPETVLNNARELGIDLSDVEDVFLSHNHYDHTGGLLTLRRELKKHQIKHEYIHHPAARGKIRIIENYKAHVKEQLGSLV